MDIQVKETPMTFDPKAEGFRWPTETDITNAAGQTLHVKPFAIRPSGLATASNDREKECFRFYETPIGILTELEVNYWRIGGTGAAMDFLKRFNALFPTGKTTLSVRDVVNALVQGGVSAVEVEVNLGWLIKGNYVTFDPDRMLIGRK